MSIWFKANKLSLNLTKTKWTLFHSQKKRRLIANIAIRNGKIVWKHGRYC